MTEPTYTEDEVRAAVTRAGLNTAWANAVVRWLTEQRAAVESPAQPPATHCHCLIHNTPCDCWYDTECTCTPLSQAMCPVHGNVTETVIAEFGRGADVPTTEPPCTCWIDAATGTDETGCARHDPAAGTSPTTPEEPAGHVHDDYCQDVMCPVPDPPAARPPGRDPNCGLTHPHTTHQPLPQGPDMRLAISVLGTEILTIETGPRDPDNDTEPITGTPSSVEFGYAPSAPLGRGEYWEEDTTP